MKNKSISEKILAIEESIQIDQFKYRGVDIWPVIRIAMYLTSKSKTSKVRVGMGLRIKLIYNGIIELIKKWFKNYPHADILFLTSDHYKVLINEIKYDRIIDPFVKWMKEQSITFRVAEFGEQHGFSNHSNREQIISIQPVFYLLSIFWKVKFVLTRNSFLEGDIVSLNKMIKQHNINFSVNTSFLRRLHILYNQSLIFDQYLKRLNVKRVFVVCYYDFKSLSLVWSCNRLGIPTMDLQHGVQGTMHLAYAKWPLRIASKSMFIPTHFWVWDKFNKAIISSWKIDHENIIVGYNKWVADRISKSTKEILLFTAQPIDNCIPYLLIESIRKYTGDKKWYLRLHPHQISQINEFEKLLQREEILDKVNIREASLMPLTDVLSKTHIHITCFSSVSIEAFYFGTPTIFIDERGSQTFKQMIPDNMIYAVSGTNSLEDILNRLRVYDFGNHVKSSEEVEDRFNNINKFIS